MAIFIVAHGLQPFLIPAILGASLNIGLSFVLIPQFGILGAAMATFIAELLSNNPFVFYHFQKVIRRHGSFTSVLFKGVMKK